MSKDNNKYDEIDDEFIYDDEEDTGSGTDWAGMIHKLLAKKKLFIISFFVTAIIATPIILTIPKFYIVQVKLAPELASAAASSGGGLSSIMRSFGIGSSTSSSGDAILPTLYPDLMNSKTFLVSLFDVPVQSQDGTIKTTYYDYMLKHQKAPIYSVAINSVIKGIMSLIPREKGKAVQTNTVNAGALTVPQTQVAARIMENVICAIDSKTGIISIRVQDQDPVICTTIADSACQHLQDFITEYRTKKSRVELQNVQKQYEQSKAAYDIAKQKVESFNNSNWDLVDEDFIVEKQALQNDMQLKFSNMSAFNQQLLNARSKYESMRPVFTVLNGASVPLVPAGPSRGKALLLALVLVLGVEVVWVLFKDKAKEKIASLKHSEEA